MKKGLVISWYFPPINSSEGLVTFKLLKNSKYEYDVFTQKSNEAWTYGAKENKLVSKNIHTYFSNSGDFNEWVKEGIEFFRKHQNEYDFIMSRSMAPESHIIAKQIKKENPNIKWIASFGDPICDNPFTYFYSEKNPYTVRGIGLEYLPFSYLLNPKRIIKSIIWTIRRKRYNRKKNPETKNIKLQQEVLNNADVIIFNNKFQQKHMLKNIIKKEEIEQKSLIIPHTFDSEFYDENIKKSNTKIKMSYLGHCDEIRTPKNYLLALSKLKKVYPNIAEKLDVEFYGNISTIDKALIIDEELYDFVKIRKPVTYFESLKIMKESDWLLVIDANLSSFLNENIFFAAKIADYLGSSSNIFGITMTQGASADILRETNSIICSYSVDEIYMYMKQIIGGKCEFKTINQYKYDIKNVVNEYDKVVEKLVDRKK